MIGVRRCLEELRLWLLTILFVVADDPDEKAGVVN
jgi:hypothetical protein